FALFENAVDLCAIGIIMLLMDIDLKAVLYRNLAIHKFERTNAQHPILCQIETRGLRVQNNKGIFVYAHRKFFAEACLIIQPKSRKFQGFLFGKEPHQRGRFLSWNLISSKDCISLMVLKVLLSFIFSSLFSLSNSMNRPESLCSNPCLVLNFKRALLAYEQAR